MQRCFCGQGLLATELTYPTVRTALFEFYQRLSGVPTFETERHGGTPDLPFLCTLTCPAVETPKGSYEECKFRAAGRSKKAAEHAASEKALEFIRSKGLLPEHVVDAAPPSAAALGDEVRTAVDARMAPAWLLLHYTAGGRRNAACGSVRWGGNGRWACVRHRLRW